MDTLCTLYTEKQIERTENDDKKIMTYRIDEIRSKNTTNSFTCQFLLWQLAFRGHDYHEMISQDDVTRLGHEMMSQGDVTRLGHEMMSQDDVTRLGQEMMSQDDVAR